MSFNFIPDHQFSWTPIDQKKQIWTAQYYVPKFKCRSVALKLKSGGCLILSPAASLAKNFHKELPELGKPEILLVPNYFHHYGIPAWFQLYPEIKIVASSRAIPRLKKLGYESIYSTDILPRELPENIELLEPAGSRAGEVWLRVRMEEEITWIVCDAFFNMPKLSPRFLTRLIQRAMKAAPGLSISRVVKWILIKNRSLYREWVLEQLEKDQPSILIPAHGEIIRDKELPIKLKRLIEIRF